MRISRMIRHRQIGLTMVELMVAMTIGLIVTFAVTSLYVSNQTTGRAQSGHAQMQDNARFAMGQIGRIVKQAGYYDALGGTFNASGTYNPAPTDASGNFSSPSIQASDVVAAVNDAAVSSFTASNGLSILNGVTSDEFTIGFLTGPQASSGNAMPDCLGNSVTVANTLVKNRFYISANTIGGVTRPTLMCDVTWNGVAPSSPNLSSGPVADNIERLQVLLGVDSDGDGVPDSYVPPGSGVTMSQVVAMRIALLARTDPVYGQNRAEPASFNMFGSNYAGTNDSGTTVSPLSTSTNCTAAAPCWTRRVFESTFSLRNRKS